MSTREELGLGEGPLNLKQGTFFNQLLRFLRERLSEHSDIHGLGAFDEPKTCVPSGGTAST